MNDLFSTSFSHSRNSSAAATSPDHHHHHPPPSSIEMSTAGTNLDKFFSEVESLKDELKQLETIHQTIQSSNELSKTLHSSKSIKELRAKMDTDVSLALKLAKLIRTHLEALDRANATNRLLSGCGPGSSSDRTRTSVVSGLRKKLEEIMNNFNSLRTKITTEYRDTVKRRYFTVTGENPDEKTLDILIETGESETFMQKAIQEQGRGRVIDVISEIQERYDAVRDIERNMKELHQVFLDMAVLVETQGEHLDDIESQMARASSYIRGGTQQLQVAKATQKNTRKWTCFAILLLLIIILVILLPILLKN